MSATVKVPSSPLPGFRAHFLRMDFLWFLPIGVVAVYFRLSDLSARNFWTDEAWVALAALAPTPAEALALGRSTPAFYTLALWLLARLFGGSEAVLRSLSFAFGVGVVLLGWRLFPLLTSRISGIVGLLLVSFSPVMVYFSKELKQYSADAFFALLLVWLGESLKNHPQGRTWLSLGLAGAVSLGFSHATIFVLPAVLLVLWLDLPRNCALRTGALAASWGFAFLIFYLLFLRRQVDPELVAYWAPAYPDFSGLLPFTRWLGTALANYFHYFFSPFFSPSWGWLAGILFTIAGLIHCLRNPKGRLPIYWLIPILMAFFASALHRYPFMGPFNGSRLFLFSAPWLYMLAGVGLVAICSFLRTRSGFLAPGTRSGFLAPATLMFFLILALKPQTLIRENLHPSGNRQELKPLVEHLQRHLRPDDLIYVYFHAVFPFKYYFQGNFEQVIWGKSCVESGLEPPASPSQPSRLWLVAAHFPDLDYLRQFAVRLLGPAWEEQGLLTRTNAALMLFIRHPDSRERSRRAPPEPP